LAFACQRPSRRMLQLVYARRGGEQFVICRQKDAQFHARARALMRKHKLCGQSKKHHIGLFRPNTSLGGMGELGCRPWLSRLGKYEVEIPSKWLVARRMAVRESWLLVPKSHNRVPKSLEVTTSYDPDETATIKQLPTPAPDRRLVTNRRNQIRQITHQVERPKVQYAL
jgi:hypothetical protein